MLEYLTIDECEEIAQRCGSGHWDCTPLARRWDYHQKAIDILKCLALDTPEQILELGTMGGSLVKGSHTMDYDKRWNFPGKNPTYLHDATKIPWPVPDKKYEAFVALRVYQHLVPVQQACFLEARRISKRVVIVVPSEYNNKVLPESKGITYEEFYRWNNQVSPSLAAQTQMGDLYFWDDDPSSGRRVRKLLTDSPWRRGREFFARLINKGT